MKTLNFDFLVQRGQKFQIHKEPDRLLTGKKDEKQEEIKPISTKHLSLRGLETIADVKNGCGYLFMSSCHDNQHSSYLSALQAN